MSFRPLPKANQSFVWSTISRPEATTLRITPWPSVMKVSIICEIKPKQHVLTEVTKCHLSKTKRDTRVCATTRLIYGSYLSLIVCNMHLPLNCVSLTSDKRRAMCPRCPAGSCGPCILRLAKKTFFRSAHRSTHGLLFGLFKLLLALRREIWKRKTSHSLSI